MGIFRFNDKKISADSVIVPSVEDNGGKISKVYFGRKLMWDLRNKTRLFGSAWVDNVPRVSFMTVNGTWADVNAKEQSKDIVEQGKPAITFIGEDGALYYAANVPKEGFYFASDMSYFFEGLAGTFKWSTLRHYDYVTGEFTRYTNEDATRMTKYVDSMDYTFSTQNGVIAMPAFFTENIKTARGTYSESSGLWNSVVSLKDARCQSCFKNTDFGNNTLDFTLDNCIASQFCLGTVAGYVNGTLKNMTSMTNMFVNSYIGNLNLKYENCTLNITNGATIGNGAQINMLSLDIKDSYLGTGFYLSKVKKVSKITAVNSNCESMFDSVNTLTEFGDIDLTDCDANYAFGYCPNLVSVNSIKCKGNTVLAWAFDMDVNLKRVGNFYFPATNSIQGCFSACSNLGGNFYFPNTSGLTLNKVRGQRIFGNTRTSASPRINIYMPKDEQNCVYWVNINNEYFQGKSVNTAANLYVYEYNTYFAE